MLCKSCKRPFVSNYKGQTLRFHNKALVFHLEKSQAILVCKNCGEENLIPIRLEKSFEESQKKRKSQTPEIFVITDEKLSKKLA